MRPPAPAPEPEPSLRIAKAQITRFPASADQEDFRMLQLEFSSEARAAFDAGRATVEVVFYERSEATGAVTPSRTVASRGPVPIAAGAWRPGEVKSMSVPYSIQKSASSAALRYHGFRVRVFAGGRLVDEQTKLMGGAGASSIH